MDTFDPMAEFEHLLSGFAQLQRAAHELQSPNSGDDEFIKIAIIGFSLHEKMERWGRSHYEFIKARRIGELSDENLDWYEEFAPSVAAFSCLALGAMQGLYSRGQIDDTEFLHGDALLPGFISMNVEQIHKQHNAGASDISLPALAWLPRR